MPTLTITKLGGGLTRKTDGDINSGLAQYDTSWGYDPFSKPGNLTWMEQPSSILSFAGTAGPIVVMKQRTEADTSYVYAVARNSNLYKIQVNDPNNNNANLDSPSVVGAFGSSVNPVRSAGMVFFGSTERIFYGDDNAIQRINFDGSSSSVVGVGSVVTSVPRPMNTFLGKIYFGNGNNIGEIDSTETVTNSNKLSPALPSGTYVRDLDVTPDGNYLQITATRNNTQGGFITLDATPAAATESYKFLWNGTDTGYTSSENYSGIGLTSNTVFGDNNFTLGYDQGGAAIYSGSQKKVTLVNSVAPHPTAAFSIGNMLGFMAPEFDGKYKGSLYNYGSYDDEVPKGLFRLLRQTGSVKDEVNFIPAAINVSNLFYYPAYSTYTNDIAGTGKMYFSTTEASDANQNNFVEKLWKFTTVPTGVGSIVAGVYETQAQLFSKKVSAKEVRVYTDPLVADNSFTIDLIGSGGSVLSSSSKTFTVGTNVTAGADLVAYNPGSPPTYALGVRITNSSVLGTKNWTGTKIEVDYVDAGK